MSTQASGYLFADNSEGVRTRGTNPAKQGRRLPWARQRAGNVSSSGEEDYPGVWRPYRSTRATAGRVFVGFVLGSALVIAFAALSITGL